MVENRNNSENLNNSMSNSMWVLVIIKAAHIRPIGYQVHCTNIEFNTIMAAFEIRHCLPIWPFTLMFIRMYFVWHIILCKLHVLGVMFFLCLVSWLNKPDICKKCCFCNISSWKSAVMLCKPCIRSLLRTKTIQIETSCTREYNSIFYDKLSLPRACTYDNTLKGIVGLFFLLLIFQF